MRFFRRMTLFYYAGGAMKTIRLFIISFFAVVLIAAVGIPTKPQYQVQSGEEEVLIAGRNVNMVSGTTLPDGDPYLQRQNEPSLAVSSRNPMHLLAGSNDYRTVDMPIVGEELPGIEEMAAADAWVSYYTSDDGGESWKTSLLPGFPQDTSTVGMESPLKTYSTAADPHVISGTEGRLYFSGLAFNRNGSGSAIFVARFEDTNDKETGNTIYYRGNTIVATGNAGQFLDMPSTAVDVPRGANNDYLYLAYTTFLGNLEQNVRSRIMFTRSTDGGLTWSNPIKVSESQHIIQCPRIGIDPENGDVYVVFRRFYHKSQDSGIVIVKSTDRGQTFSSPEVVTPFLNDTFDQPATANEGLYPDPDDFILGESFRTNSYSSIAVDKNHRVFVAYAQRGFGESGEARIMLRTGVNGTGWDGPYEVGPLGYEPITGRPYEQGHQFMPQISISEDIATLVWYDQHEDWSAQSYGWGDWISDHMVNDDGDYLRRTVDVWAAQVKASLYADPSKWSFTQVSRYLYALALDSNGDVVYEDDPNTGELEPVIIPVQFNCPNFPLNKGGMLPFIGDYIAIAPAKKYKVENGDWLFNSEPSGNHPIFHVAWTDNRDVRPPTGNWNWTDYVPVDPDGQPGEFISTDRADCFGNVGNKPAIRNQNVYTAKLSLGVLAASPTNKKKDDLAVARSFVVYVKNNTEIYRSFRLTIIPPSSGYASFLQFDDPINPLTAMNVVISPFSTISRQVYIDGTNAPVRIDIEETLASGAIDPNGLKSYVIINSDPSSDGVSGSEETHQPIILDPENPNIVNWVCNPNIVNPNIVNPNIVNPNIVNPNIVNPNIVNDLVLNPNIVNPNIVNPNIVNPNIVNPNIVNELLLNPNIVNPNIVNPNIVNPNIVNPNIVNPNIVNIPDTADFNDVVWTVKNEGNTTTAYTLMALAEKSPPPGVYTQLIVYKANYTPAVAGEKLNSEYGVDTCKIRKEPNHELILNIVNPNIVNPNIVNPNIVNPNIVNPNIVNPNIVNASILDASFSLAPEEEAFVDLRVMDTEGWTLNPELVSAQGQFSIQAIDVYDFIDSIGFAITSQAVDSEDAEQGIRTPKGDATDVYIVSSDPPDGVVGTSYNAYISAFGGARPYSWELNSGVLPPGLFISTYHNPPYYKYLGMISGTPTAVGTYSFVVQVTDAEGKSDIQLFNITIHQDAATLGAPDITTTSLPSGVVGTWYGAAINVAGGTRPLTWSWSGFTPEADGLILDPLSGIITGTPTVATTYTFDVTVTDYDGDYDTVTYDLDILASTGEYLVISGAVYDDASNPLEGVQLYGLPNSPITDSYGHYEDHVPEGWSGTVIPFKLNYSFIPENRVYVQVDADHYMQDYNQQEWYATQSDVVRVTDMVVDSFGNAYVSGCGNSGAYVAKYDNMGTFRWDYRDGSSADDLFYGLCVDPDGNVYVTGKVNNDIKTVKLHPDTGLEQWSDVYDSGYVDDEGLDIAIDALGNVYVTGASATANPDIPDFITIKYEPSGTRKWERVYDNGDIDLGIRVAIDSAGDIIVAGNSIDLGGGTDSDLYIIKYNSVGNIVWDERYDYASTLDSMEDLCLDGAGNVYVTGWTSTGENQADYLTVKISTLGSTQWARTYDGAGDQFDDWAYAITVDADGYVYVTGRSGEYLCDPPHVCDDFATIKYDPSGNPVWIPGADIDANGAARYDGPPGFDHDVARDIEVDPLGNVYVSGRSVGNDGSFDFATLIYDSAGVKIWESRYSIDSRSDEAEEIELDPEGNIIVSGPSGDELLVLKYSQSFPTSLSITTEALPNGVAGMAYDAVLEAFGGTGIYDWSISAGALPDNLFLDNTAGVIYGTPSTAGTFNFTAEVTDGTLTDSKPMSITISVAPASQVDLTGPSSVAAGVVSGAFTLTSQNSAGVPTNVTADTVFDLSSNSSGTATFYSDAGGTNEISPPQVTIVNGTNSANFYYKDTSVGVPTVTASWTNGGTDLGSATHPISVTAPPTPTQVELTGPARVGGGFISEPFTLTSQDIGGNPINVTQDTVFNLSSDSSGIFTFYSDPEGTAEITQVTIPTGQNSVTFFYMDAVPATPTVTTTWVSGDPGLGPANLQTTVWAVVGQIAFASDRDGDYEIFIMNADGSGQIQVTDNNDADVYPSWSRQGSKIVFQSHRDGNNEIYIMNADGSGQTRLTDNSAQDNFPKLSPDGSKIAFTSSRDGNDDIFVMNADGSSPTNLTNHPASDLHPSWSPDGTKISFMSTRDGDSEIFVMDADGSNPIQLTFNTVGNAYSSWSPDGSKIAYSHGSGTTCEIYIMNADGSNPTQLTNNSSFDSIPSWSPDGSRIVFMSYRDGHDQVYTMNADGSGQMNITNNPTKESWPNWGGAKIAFHRVESGDGDIYIMNADSSGQTNLTNSPTAYESNPSWSPGGTKIAFTYSQGGEYDIYVMNADGSGQINLTGSSVGDQEPCWSPDGSKIAFQSARDGDYEIYIMNADGSGIATNLTNLPGVEDKYPSWSPDGTKIAFTSSRDTNEEIYVMNADGSAQTRLTTDGNADLHPCWSPDGSNIVFRSDRDGNPEIYIMNADGSGQMPLTTYLEMDDRPGWSPDGHKIIFHRNAEYSFDIYTMNPDGTGLTNITNDLVNDYDPSWRSQPRMLASLVTNQVVMSGPSSVEAGTVSGAFTLTSLNSLGMSTNVVGDTDFSFSTSSGGTVTYYSDSDGTDEITQLTIASGTNSATFYYKDTESGSQTVTLTYSSGPMDLGTANHIIEVTTPPMVPDIIISQEETIIADSGVFDFGSQAVGSNTDVVFTIQNQGDANLTIATPLEITTGVDSDQFSVQDQPTSPVGSGDSTTFTIRFNPTSEGGKSVSIAIASNAPDENPYDITLTGTGTAAPAVAAWAKTYGGLNPEWPNSIQQTSDGGFIAAGTAQSFGAGGNDFWVVKLDSAGEIDWQKTYGGSVDDIAYSIQQTSDGGFIAVGRTYSFGAGGNDFWVMKLDSAGEIDWQKTYGGSSTDSASSIQQTSDGGYIVAGVTYSYGAGPYDFWVMKLDGVGEIDWQKTYGGSSTDYAYSIQQTFDGGYIVVGETLSFGAGGNDFWVVKLDSAGEIDWQKTYGGLAYDIARSIQQTSDGGYIAAGETLSFGAGGNDFWVMKLDGVGEVEWQKTYGGSYDDIAYSIQQTSDGGYIAAGDTLSFGAGQNDSWVMKLDGAGEVEWQKTYGGSSYDSAYSIQQTSDGGYIATGYTQSFGAGHRDFWLLKLNPNGSIDPSCSPGLGAESTAISASTSVTPSTSIATAVDSSAIIADTSVTPTDSSATVQTQCMSVGLPLQLAFSQQPSNTAAGSIITPAVTIEIQDQWGNLVTTATDTVTLSLQNAGGAALDGTTSTPAVGGIATFDDLSIDEIGAGYFLRANSGSLTEVDSIAFQVTAAAPEVISVDPTSGNTDISSLVVTIYGLNFADGATAELHYNDTENFTAISTNFISESELQGIFDLTSVTTHLGEAWDVKVTNPDTQFHTGEDLFTIYLPDPTVTGISPPSGTNTTPQMVTITGTNFVQGESINITLSKLPGPEIITGTSITIDSSTQITCNFDLTGATTGAWDVIVEFPTVTENPGVLAGGFSIVTGGGGATQVELTGPAKVGGGFISDAFTLTSQDELGQIADVYGNTNFALSSDSSGTSTFFSDAEGDYPITQVTIPAGEYSVTFYYMDDSLGNPTVTATWAGGGSDLGFDTHQLTSWVVTQQIAFVSLRDGNFEIYTMNADGTAQTRLTNNSSDDDVPDWSPDGSKIAFASVIDGHWQICTMNADGSHLTQLTYGTDVDSTPSWSPDGSKIAYTNRQAGNYEIYVMNADGTGSPINLTNNAAADRRACWSPDGTKIIFDSDRGDGDCEVYIMNADGTDPTPLTDNLLDDYMAKWSPDGTKIAFVRDHGYPGGNEEIYVMNSDGSGQTNLTNYEYSDFWPNWSPDSSRIVFHSWRSGDHDVYTMDADGNNVTRLTSTPDIDKGGDWGGAKIAFYSTRDGDEEIYIMNADGSGQTNLTDNSASDMRPSWSPDGTKIAFQSNRDDAYPEIYTMDADGSNVTRLTNDPEIDMSPSWSPYGNKIVFVSRREGNDEIYIMDASGSNITRLTDNSATDLSPSWSPDGTKIVFVSSQHPPYYDVYIMDADGSNVTHLTDNSANDSWPSWSPNGTKILFVSHQTGNVDIYVMDTDGSNVTRLTNDPAIDNYPCWSPDGRKIVFVSDRDGNDETYIMDADGSNETRLTGNSGDYNKPSWRQQGRILHEYEFISAIDESGSGDGQFNNPMGIVIDSLGYVYIADNDNYRVQKFQPGLGSFVLKWGGSMGSGDGQFDTALGMAIDNSGYVYVADAGSSNDRIQKFDSDGNFVAKWGSRGTNDGQFNTPRDVAVDSSDNIYVVDMNNSRIQKFDSDGNFILKWGSNGTADGQFTSPHGIAIDGYDNVYVTDRGFHRIQKFDSDGNFITKWGSLGTGNGQFNHPCGIAVDNDGCVYVVDQTNNRIQKFNSIGMYLTQWGSTGSGNGQFNVPSYIAVDSDGYVYVTDSSNDRVQKFRRKN
jgi:uncharacterized delta-60 repeat protein